jgi:Resolvase, N terminal domain
MTEAALRKATLLVHGYLRMEEPDEPVIGLMSKQLATVCMRNGYRLGSIFIDRGVPDDVFARTGLSTLLDAVRLTRRYAVMVPDLDHLSAREFVRDALQRMVELAGSQVIVAYQVSSGGSPAPSAAGRAGSGEGSI